MQSSTEAIRALKTGRDDGTKAQLACQIWESEALTFPRKSEVLLEFVLDRLLKGREETGPFAPLPQELYWSLLDQLVEHTGDALPALVARIPTLPILTSVFATRTLGDGIMRYALAIYARLLPLATRRASIDTLLECLKASLERLDDSTAAARKLIVLFLREAELAIQAGGVNARKKASSFFVQHGLSPLLAFLARDVRDDAFRATIRDSTQALLFSLPLLQKAALPAEVIERILSIAQSNANVSIAFADLLQMYTAALRRHAGTLFPLSRSARSGDHSRSALELHQLSQIRSNAFLFLDQLLNEEMDVLSLQRLVAVVASESLYVAGGGVDSSLEVLRRATRLALQSRSSDGLTILSKMIKLDFRSVSPYLPDLLASLAALPNGEDSQNLLAAISEYHSKTRQLSAYLDLLYEALGSAPGTSAAYASSLAASAGLRKELSASLNAMQALPLLQNALGRFTALAAVGHEANEGQPRKKRRKLDGSAGQLRLAAAFVASIAIESIALPKPDKDAIIELFSLVCESDAVQDPLKCVLLKGKTSDGDQDACIAALRVLQSIRSRQADLKTTELGASLSTEQIAGAVTVLSGPAAAYKPELLFELARWMLGNLGSLPDPTAHSSFSAIVSILTQPSATWDGQIHGMTHEQLTNAIAVLCGNSLKSVEQKASQDQLQAFALFLLSAGSVPETEPAVASTADSIRDSIFASAELYELPRLRDAVQHVIMSKRQLEPAIWSRLAAMPTDYIPLAARRALAQKALSASGVQSAHQFALTTIRGDPSGTAVQTLSPSGRSADPMPLLESLTGLIDDNGSDGARAIADIFAEVFLAAVRHAQDQLIGHLPRLIEILGQRAQPGTTACQMLCAMLKTCVEQVKEPASVPSKVTKGIRAALHATVESSLPLMEGFRDDNHLLACSFDLARVLQAACYWAGSGQFTLDKSTIWSHNELQRIYIAIDDGANDRPDQKLALAVLKFLLPILAKSQSVEPYECFLGLAVAFTATPHDLTSSEFLRPVLSAAFRHAPPEAYSTCLSALEARVATHHDEPLAFGAAFDIATCLLANGPDGSDHIAKASISRVVTSILAFLSEMRPTNAQYCDPALRFLVFVCTDKSALLDRLDGASIFASFSILLQLQPNARREIAVACSRLVTRRTDLARSLLPSLCRLAAQLLAACSPTGHIDEHDEAVGRLLAILGSSKALAGGLKKHAIFVLLPWLRAGSPGRNALGPKTGGLNALLGALGKFERDSLLASYLGKEEEAERVALKAMMREYERTRYKGEA